MQSFDTILWIFFLAVFGLSESLKIEDAKISNIVMMGNVAEVQRSLSVDDLVEGYNTLELEELPNYVDENSIRISGTGTSTLLSSSIEAYIVVRETDIEFVQLIDELMTVV